MLNMLNTNSALGKAVGGSRPSQGPLSDRIAKDEPILGVKLGDTWTGELELFFRAEA